MFCEKYAVFSVSVRNARNIAAASCCSGDFDEGMARPVPPVGVPPPSGPSGRYAVPTSNDAASSAPLSEPVEPMVEAMRPDEKSTIASSAESVATPFSWKRSCRNWPPATDSSESSVRSNPSEYAPPWPQIMFSNHHAPHDGPVDRPSVEPPDGTSGLSDASHSSSSAHAPGPRSGRPAAVHRSLL